MTRQCGLLWLAVSAAPGCYPGTFDSPDETNVVITSADQERDFSDFGRFALEETVYDLSDIVDNPIAREDRFDEQILDTYAAQMASNGWERTFAPEADQTDVLLLIGAVAANNYLWLGGAGWGYYPGWIYYYPEYWSQVNVPTGTIVALMVKPDELDEDAKVVPIIWASVLSGVVQADLEGAEDRIDRLVEQAFAQSPYLKVGPPVTPPSLDGGAMPVDGGAQ